MDLLNEKQYQKQEKQNHFRLAELLLGMLQNLNCRYEHSQNDPAKVLIDNN